MHTSLRGLASWVAHVTSPTGRVIKDIPEWAGFGNQLFFYLWADTCRRRGIDYSLVRGERPTAWLKHFPRLAELTISRSERRLADHRDDTDWHTVSSVGHPSTATRDDVEQFIATYLLPSGVFGVDASLAAGATLNVRRGDYYSDPDVRGRFSFDQIAYIDVVLGRITSDNGRLPELRVVSDDIAWCRTRLAHLGERADHLEFVDSNSPLDDLRTVACSRELIIMNSSFSIWAAYISNVLHADNYHLIHVPAFGTRPFSGVPWPSIDERWDIIRSIPGGWDS